jgi:hypothetical protein
MLPEIVPIRPFLSKMLPVARVFGVMNHYR